MMTCPHTLRALLERARLLSGLTARLVLTAGVILATGAALFVHTFVTNGAEQEFSAHVKEVHQTLLNRLEDHARILLGGAALFQSSETVTREEWCSFIRHQQFDALLPGIQGMGFSLLIPRPGLTGHLQTIRDEGFPDYSVKPEGERAYYSSIIYLEPFSERNLRAFGYDMLTEPVRRLAMEQARDTGAAALSGKVTLVQETAEDVQAGALMYVPVYRKGMPVRSVEQRRAALYGWVYSPYRMNDLFQGIFSKFLSQHGKTFHMAAFDGEHPVPEKLLCECHPNIHATLGKGMRFMKVLPIIFNGHRWTLCLTQANGHPLSADRLKVFGTWAGCVLVSVLLFVLIRTMQNTRAEAQRMAHALTLDLRRSKDKYRLLVDNSRDIIYTLSCDGTLSFASPAWHRLLGHPDGQVLGRRFQDFIHPEERVAFMTFLEATITSRQRQQNIEYRMRHHDGSWFWHNTSATPLTDEAGTVVGVEGSARDITERKRIEASLQQSAERLTVATRAGGVGIWDYDVVADRLLWDDQMYRLYGITREAFDCEYEAWQQALHPEDRQRSDEAVRQALSGEKDFNLDFRIVWPDASVHFIRGFATVQRDAAGQPLRMVGTNWDITDTKRTQAALRESEANFRTFFETLTDMIMVGTPEGRILYTNNAVTRILGYTPAELAEAHLLDLHPADKREEAEEIFAAMFRGERENCPLPLARKDGRPVPVETRVWFGKWNGADCLFGISKDLSAEQEAKQLFERLFRKNPSLIALSALSDRRFLDVNDTFLTKLGYTREDVLGRTSSEVGLFLDQDQLTRVADTIIKDGSITDAELQVRRKDGTVLVGLFSGEIINSQSQRYLLTVMNDITARKRAEAELARLSRLQHTLMRLATDFVNVQLEEQDAAIRQSLETMGQLIQADRAYLFAYDLKREVISNTHEWCNTGITPEIGNLQEIPFSLVPDWVAAHRRGEMMHVPDVTALPPDSGVRQVLEPQGIHSLITLPLMQASRCLGFVGFDAVREKRVWQEEEVSLLQVLAELYANFESRRAAEHEMRDLQNRLSEACHAAQEAARAKSLFLANMSHEIRTPLNAILGYAQIMRQTCQRCPTGERLKTISRSGEHLLRLLNDLLELARSDSHTLALSESAFDLYHALEDVRLMFVRQTDTQAVALELHRGPGVPQFICSDSGKIRQILVNLVSNALKFTAKGSVRVSACVLRTDPPRDITLAIDVHDTGTGIAANEVDRIFNVFEQSASGKQFGKGTGLGLPLSRRYAQRLGGDITVTSKQGEGSTFRFTFRTRVAELAELLPTRKICRLAPGQQACHVLAVDDDPASRDVLTAMLEPVGFTVETAGSAAEALSLLSQTHDIGLVLMDKQMPEMNGYEAVRILRTLPGGRRLAVLIVTASGDTDEKSSALAAEANGYVPKPVRRDTLLEEIRRVTGVRYEYDGPPSLDLVPKQPYALTSEALSALSSERQSSLYLALQRGDITQLRKLVEELSLDHAELAAEIGVLVNAYDYDRLLLLLAAVKEGTPDETPLPSRHRDDC